MRSRPSSPAAPFWLGVALLVGLAAATLLASGSRDLPARAAPASEFSIVRALSHVRALTRHPGQTGSFGNAERRRYIQAQLAELGIATEAKATDAAVSMLGRIVAARVHNITARIPGRESGAAVMLSAHYDAVPNSPGASDDAAGVATLLETARVLRRAGPLRRDVVLLFTDGEELGLLGADAFVSEHPLRRELAFSMNFEARGSRGASAMYETSLPNRDLIEKFAQAVPHPVGSSLLSSLSRALPNDTDFTILRRSGVSGFAFAYADGFTRYHRSTDSVERLDPRSLQHHGSYATSLAKVLANSAPTTPSTRNVVYFDVFGRKLLWYPEALAPWLGASLAVGASLLLWRARRAGWARGRGVAWGVLGCLGCLTASAVVSTVVDATLGLALEKDRRVEWAAPLVVVHGALCLAACLGVYRSLLRRASDSELQLGSLCVGAFLSVLLGFGLPGASYAPQWLTLSGLVGWWAIHARASGMSDTTAAWLSGLSLLPAAFFVSSVGYAFFVLMGTQLPAATALALGWGAALFLPWSASRWHTAARPLQLGLTGIGVIAALSAWVLGEMTPKPPTFTDLSYVLDVDAQRARWLASVGLEHPWVQAILRTESPNTSEYFPGKPQHTASAPPVALQPSAVRVVSQERRAGERDLTLSIEARPGARCVSLLQLAGGKVHSGRVNGKAPHPNIRFGEETDKKLWYLVTGERLADGFNLQYCGLDGRPLSVELTTTGEPLRLRVVDASDGLPQTAIAGQPSDLLFDINGNRTLVSQDVSL